MRDARGIDPDLLPRDVDQDELAGRYELCLLVCAREVVVCVRPLQVRRNRIDLRSRLAKGVHHTLGVRDHVQEFRGQADPFEEIDEANRRPLGVRLVPECVELVDLLDRLVRCSAHEALKVNPIPVLNRSTVGVHDLCEQALQLSVPLVLG